MKKIFVRNGKYFEKVAEAAEPYAKKIAWGLLKVLGEDALVGVGNETVPSAFKIEYGVDYPEGFELAVLPFPMCGNTTEDYDRKHYPR